MLLVGASGSMKTNSALDVLSKFSGTFHKIVVVCRNESEPLYEHLRKKISDEDQLEFVEIIGDDLSGLPSVNDFNKKEPSLVIFDDLCLVKKQEDISEFFIRARKVGVSCMYLTQSYYSAPKVIRSQCNYILLKKISSTNDLRMILSEYSLQVDVDQLKQMYTQCTKEKLDWLMIAVENPPHERFWHNYEKLQGNQYHGVDEESPQDFKDDPAPKESEKIKQPEAVKPKEDPAYQEKIARLKKIFGFFFQDIIIAIVHKDFEPVRH